MLVLSRKKNQEVCLSELGVNIKVLQIKGNTVRLGIEAPDDIHILRGELKEIRQGFESAAKVTHRDEANFLEQVA